MSESILDDDAGNSGTSFTALASAPSAPAQSSTIPINGICVTDPAYGAVDDGRNAFLYATWLRNDTRLSVFTSRQAVTVANTGPDGVAQVTLPGATSSTQLGPQQSWVGKPIAIAGAGASGAILVSRVAAFFYDPDNANAPTAVLTSSAPTPMTSSVQQIACPCFTTGIDGSGLPNDAGKKIWISSGGMVIAVATATLPFVPMTLTIVEVVTPFQITTDVPIAGRGVTAVPTLIEWGTDNTTAVVAAATAVLAGGGSQLFFPGFTSKCSTGRFCLFNYSTNDVGAAQIKNDFVNNYVLSSIRFITSNATTFITDVATGTGNTGFQNNAKYIQGIPWNAPAPPPPKVSFSGTQLPRCATLNEIVLLVCGDSWGNLDPSGENNSAWGPFLQNFIKQNLPNKKIVLVPSGANGLTWNALVGTIGDLATVTVPELGTVTPDLVLLAITSGNDSGQIMRSDIQTIINAVKGWSKTNGLPPDIAMITGTYPRTLAPFSYNPEWRCLMQEYGAVLQRSLSRVNGIPLVDIARAGGFALHGWSEDALTIRQVPAIAAGTAGPNVPYVIPYLCRDFLFVFQLGSRTQSGSTFWSAAGWLGMQLSPKPDNRMYVYAAPSNTMEVIGVTWGMTVPTAVTMPNNSAALTTSGQTEFATPVRLMPTAPAYALSHGSAGFTQEMLGQCLWAQGAYYSNRQDFRTYFSGFVNNAYAQVMDAASGGLGNTSPTPSAMAFGGQMFIPSDATGGLEGGGVNVIVQSAGTTSHPFTGANSLVTTVAGYSTHLSVVLAAANSRATISATVQNVFVGLIHQQATSSYAISGGNDTGLQPCLVFRLQNSHMRVSYMLGKGSIANIRMSLQLHERLIWEGEVERYGGPFIPRVYAQNPVTVELVYAWIDDFEANMFTPRMTMTEAFGSGDHAAGFSYPYGGDSSHPSHRYLQVIDDASASQPLAIPNNFAGTHGSIAPLAGFSYTIPANQGFTALTPAGRLATGTVMLPAVFPQGYRLEVFSTQTIRSLTVTAPSGFTIQGTPVWKLPATETISYRLLGTVFYRVQ
jgi:hypothetical protein